MLRIALSTAPSLSAVVDPAVPACLPAVDKAKLARTPKGTLIGQMPQVCTTSLRIGAHAYGLLEDIKKFLTSKYFTGIASNC